MLYKGKGVRLDGRNGRSSRAVSEPFAQIQIEKHNFGFYKSECSKGELTLTMYKSKFTFELNYYFTNQLEIKKSKSDDI